MKVQGKVFYNDRRQRIDLKKPIRDLISEEPNVFYTMELCLGKEMLKQRMNELIQQDVIPVLMYFNRKV